jgi:hypothetical protein
MPISSPVPVELSEGERAQLESWARRHTSAQALALRSRVVLLAAEGLNLNPPIAGVGDDDFARSFGEGRLVVITVALDGGFRGSCVRARCCDTDFRQG